MGTFFLGPLRHWLLLVIVLGAIWLLGRSQVHISHYTVFILTLLALAFAAVALVKLTYKRGEQITREPLDGE